MTQPFYLDTSLGPLAAFADVEPALDGPATILLQGKNPLARAGAFGSLAGELSRRGHRVLRIEYPGQGLAPTQDVGTRAIYRGVIEAADTWQRATGAREMTVIGSCLGAMYALMLAADRPYTRRVVGITVPMTGAPAASPIANSIKSRIAAVEPLGALVGSKIAGWGLPKKRPDDPEGPRDTDERDPHAMIERAVDNARIVLLFGEHDDDHVAYRELVRSGAIPQRVLEHLEVEVLQGARLHGLNEHAHREWITSRVTAAIGGGTGEHA